MSIRNTPPHSTPQVMILAAGKGVRMHSTHPKVLHRIGGRSLLERTLRCVAPLRPPHILVVVGNGAELVEAEISQLCKQPWLQGIKVQTVLQKEQKGTGHAVQCALPSLSDTRAPILILPGDIPLLQHSTVTKFCDETLATLTSVAVLTCDHPAPASFGRVLRSADGSVEKIIERKDCSEQQAKLSEINSSIYLCDPDFLRSAVTELQPNNAQHEYYLTDIVAIARAQGRTVQGWKCSDPLEVSGANNRAELSALECELRRRLNQNWMERGVTLQDPTTTYIAEDAELSADVFLGPNTHIASGTQIASGVVVEGNCVLMRAHIDRDAIIRHFSVIEDARIGPQCDVGPFARIRPGSVLEEKVKIGNFVETKKTTLHAGAKANHLSYLGDATIGAHANIGAGTITCNYDGVHKYPTAIGAGTFIGSNSALVAPVTIGDGAYVGAGSVISHDVPANSLALTRSEQKTITNWAERKKKKD